MPFYGSNYTEFLFRRGGLSGGGKEWMIAPKDSVIPASPSATASVILTSSYLYQESQALTWDLSDTAKAPYIGLQDTTSGKTMGSSMFFIESSATTSDSPAFKDGVTSVWINAG